MTEKCLFLPSFCLHVVAMTPGQGGLFRGSHDSRRRGLASHQSLLSSRATLLHCTRAKRRKYRRFATDRGRVSTVGWCTTCVLLAFGFSTSLWLLFHGETLLLNIPPAVFDDGVLLIRGVSLSPEFRDPVATQMITHVTSSRLCKPAGNHGISCGFCGAETSVKTAAGDLQTTRDIRADFWYQPLAYLSATSDWSPGADFYLPTRSPSAAAYRSINMAYWLLFIAGICCLSLFCSLKCFLSASNFRLSRAFKFNWFLFKIPASISSTWHGT